MFNTRLKEKNGTVVRSFLFLLCCVLALFIGCKQVHCRFASPAEVKCYPIDRKHLGELFSSSDRGHIFVCRGFMESPHAINCWLVNASRCDYFVSICSDDASYAMRYLDQRGKCVIRRVRGTGSSITWGMSFLQGQDKKWFDPYYEHCKKWTIRIPPDCRVLLNMSIEFPYVTYQDIGRCRSGKDMEMLLEKNNCRVTVELMN